MASHQQKLSLVAQFDDLMRNAAVLNQGIEAEFCEFVKNQDTLRQQCYEDSEKAGGLKRKFNEMQEENRALQTKLKHARLQIEKEMKNKMKAEQERDFCDRQIIMVRELLMDKGNNTMLNDKDREKFAFLSSFNGHTSQKESPRVQNVNLSTIEETLSLSDISYDKTEEDLYNISHLRSGRTWKRPSAPPMELDDVSPGKQQRRKSNRHRRSRSANHVITTSQVTVQDNGQVEAETSIVANGKRKTMKHRSRSPQELRRKLRKSKSEQTLKVDVKGDSDDSYSPSRFGRSPYTPPQEGRVLRHYNSGSKSLNRPHVFLSKAVLRLENCNSCGKRIKFGKVAVRCKDCRVFAHPECKENVALPCIPATSTPTVNGSKQGYCISDYAPLDPPYIPALIIHCVNEIENRGFNEVGLYRISGSEKKVKELKEKFLKMKGTPNLTNIIDLHEICGCIKDFLRSLKDPLITRRLWKDFVEAAEMSDFDECTTRMYQAISELPQTNRDTLAFLILHFQKLAEIPECKMPLSNIAKIFGPTIIGYSSMDNAPMQMIAETRLQSMVMDRLLDISSDYWQTFINIDDDAMYMRDMMTPNTPEIKPVLRSMLGPIGNTPEAIGESSEKRSWFATPRRGSKTINATKKPTHFFNSPVLK